MDAFDALADPVRRQLLQRLAAGSARVVDLAAEYPISRPAVSRHLRILSEASLVTVTPQGRERHYAIAYDGLESVRDYLATLRGRPPVPERALDALELEVRRTTRERDSSSGRAENHDDDHSKEHSA
ncbi:ArsR/SmtB family transcription factor [Gordonia humi]|uniref:DNA-binding transcriptional ArsR family regulator n=1 Tax=Gordonia humi TaxID=686429 RepID=A0A840EPI1_9ACTN|nr:metalloregulator ArsR/SmtB family transcription factor [Gordonia humi]MBB4133602.1 DNA-binding transcriptional ArsR family regulator [Gordonia humi]